MTGRRGISPPKRSIRSSTPPSASPEVYLRVVSGGTSYSQSRLAFYPYTQVIGAICTSAPVRSSTPLSGGFNLPRRRSTGFGYPTDDSWRAHHAPHPCGLRACCFRYGFPPSGLTSPSVRTPWPVFLNGRRNAAPPCGFVAFTPRQSAAAWFQALCTSRQGYFATFAHATTALSVSGRV